MNQLPPCRCSNITVSALPLRTSRAIYSLSTRCRALNPLMYHLYTTLPKTNIAPENRWSQKENNLPNIDFQVLLHLLLVSGRIVRVGIPLLRGPSPLKPQPTRETDETMRRPPKSRVFDLLSKAHVALHHRWQPARRDMGVSVNGGT